MSVKGAVIAVFTLCLGGLLLFAQSSTGTALGVALIALVSTATVAKLTARRPTEPNGRRDPK